MATYIVKTFAVVVIAGNALAFAPCAPLRPTIQRSGAAASTLNMVYTPDGLSPQEWKKIQAKEKAAKANLGRVGLTRFKSRSFQAWQESGAGHLFPVDPKKVNAGEIPMDKVPYMQRGGAWDDSDLSKKKLKTQKDKVVISKKEISTKAWSDLDKKYAQGGYVKEQSVSIFGGAPLPWNIQKSPGVETNNNRRMGEQKKVNRPGTNRPMTAAMKKRVEKEAADERQRQEKLKAQLNGEKKKGLFGMW